MIREVTSLVKKSILLSGKMMIDRRKFLQLAAAGGSAIAMSSLNGPVLAALSGSTAAFGSNLKKDDFYFIQMSDTDWGYHGKATPEAATTLKHAIATINALEVHPAFVMFTGDLIHTTDDIEERRLRLSQFRDITAELKVSTVHAIPGIHDAALDNGAVFQEFFGDTYYAFSHKGVRFIALDNASDPQGRLGDAQLAWLKKSLATTSKETKIVVFAHRPLFELAPQWGWNTPDGAQALALLAPFANASVFYGQIHQELHYRTGNVNHHAAKSLAFAYPAPGSQEYLLPLPWDASASVKRLGYRAVTALSGKGTFAVSEQAAHNL